MTTQGYSLPWLRWLLWHMRTRLRQKERADGPFLSSHRRLLMRQSGEYLLAERQKASQALPTANRCIHCHDIAPIGAPLYTNAYTNPDDIQ